MKKNSKENPPVPAAGETRFKNLLEVLEYLKAGGWKVEKSSLYKNQGRIRREKDGSYTKQAVDEYARFCLPKLDGSGKEAEIWEKKARLENEILEERRKKIERENEIEAGLWILKSEVEQKHTAKLALFLSSVDNFINSGKPEEAIEIVSGNREKAVDFKQFIKKEFRNMLAEYAKQPVFIVPQKTVMEAEEFKLANDD